MTDDDAPRPLRSRLLVAGVAAVGVALDAVSKSWATSALADGDPIDVVAGVLRFDLSFNSGMAFSQFRGGGPVLSVVAVAAITGIIWYAGRVRSPLLLAGLGLICGGAAGNLADRLFRGPGATAGHVVDFISLPNWPTFNVADMLLTLGVVVVVVATFRAERGQRTEAEDEPRPGQAADA